MSVLEREMDGWINRFMHVPIRISGWMGGRWVTGWIGSLKGQNEVIDFD